MRVAPSVASAQVARISAGAAVEAFPSTLTQAGSDTWWITVKVPVTGDCAAIPAEFVTGTYGNLAEVVPGVTYDLPTTGSWTFLDRESVFAPAIWTLDDAVDTQISLQILDGNRIDEHLTQQRRVFEERHDDPEDWYEDVAIAGADRAVESVVVSGTGDLDVTALMLEIGDFTVVAGSSVHIDDVDVAPSDEMAAFLASIVLDRETFLSGLTTPAAHQQTIFGTNYVAIELRHLGPYTEPAACGSNWDYFILRAGGERDYAGQLDTSDLVELADRHVLWQIYCEGGDQVRFGVGRVDDHESIIVLGRVSASAVGVRSDRGVLAVIDGTKVVFEGETFGGAHHVDSFELADLLAAVDN